MYTLIIGIIHIKTPRRNDVDHHISISKTTTLYQYRRLVSSRNFVRAVNPNIKQNNDR